MSVKIMSAVFESRTLSPTERLIMLALADHADDSGRCYPSIERLGQRTGLSERAIQTNIRRLSEQGYVRIIPGGGKSRPNLYFVSANPASETPHLLHPAAETPFLVRANPASAAPNPAADAPEPSGTIIEPSNVVVVSARGAPGEWTPDSLWRAAAEAAGLNPDDRLPTYWMPPSAHVDCWRWVSETGLSPEQIIHAIRENRKSRPKPPNGPRGLTGMLRRYANALAAPPAPQARASPPAGKSNRELAEIAAAKIEAQNRHRTAR